MNVCQTTRTHLKRCVPLCSSVLSHLSVCSLVVISVNFLFRYARYHGSVQHPVRQRNPTVSANEYNPKRKTEDMAENIRQVVPDRCVVRGLVVQE